MGFQFPSTKKGNHGNLCQTGYYIPCTRKGCVFANVGHVALIFQQSYDIRDRAWLSFQNPEFKILEGVNPEFRNTETQKVS